MERCRTVVGSLRCWPRCIPIRSSPVRSRRFGVQGWVHGGRGRRTGRDGWRREPDGDAIPAYRHAGRFAPSPSADLHIGNLRPRCWPGCSRARRAPVSDPGRGSRRPYVRRRRRPPSRGPGCPRGRPRMIRPRYQTAHAPATTGPSPSSPIAAWWTNAIAAERTSSAAPALRTPRRVPIRAPAGTSPTSQRPRRPSGATAGVAVAGRHLQYTVADLLHGDI